MKNVRYVRVMVGVLVFLIVTVAVSAQDVLFAAEGSFGPGDDLSSDGAYQDTYQVRVEEGMTVEVICRSDSIDTYIRAVLPGGDTLENDDYDGFNAGFSRTIATTGTLQFSVEPLFANEEGEYEITVTSLGAAQTITLGETVEGSFGKQSGGRAADRYEFSGNAGDSIVIDLKSDDFDAYLELLSESGEEFTNDDGGGELNSRLSYRFERSETILITATGIGGDITGAYTLTVAGGAESVVAEYRGTVDRGDTRGYDGTLYDVYEYTGSEGSMIAVEVTSSDFDTVVYVSNPDGSNLGRDDDGGEGTNSILNATLPESGTYKIFVVSLFEESGDYQLTIYE